MKYKINKKEIDSADVISVLEEIAVLKLTPINSDAIDELIQVLDNTDDYKLIDTIALIFSDLNYDLALQSMVKKLDKIKNSNHTSTLIYACAEYDCAKYILFFSELLINYDYHTALECYSVLEAIKEPINLSEKIIAVKKFEKALLDLNRVDDKYSIINDALQLVKGMNIKIADN